MNWNAAFGGTLLAVAIFCIVCGIAKWVADRDTKRVTREIEEGSQLVLKYWHEVAKKKGWK